MVLIDEIEAHLHISWQKRIGPWAEGTPQPLHLPGRRPGRCPAPASGKALQVVSDDLWERVVYGSGDDAVVSELFGVDTTYSEEARWLRRELVLLEVKIIKGEADEAETARYAELRWTLTNSAVIRSREISTGLRLLGEPGE